MMFGGLLRLADEEIDGLIIHVLGNSRVQRCIETHVEMIAERVSEKLLAELVARLEAHD